MSTDYTATFHTHYSALVSARALCSHGVDARMAPVPRALSSSCGTCVMYTSNSSNIELMDSDVEGVYALENGKYKLVYENI